MHDVTDAQSHSTDSSSRFAADGGWTALLGKLASGQSLSADEAYAAVENILGGLATPAQIGGYLMALRVKSETSSEIAGMARAMRDASEPLHLPAEVIDIVGTGGSPHRRKHALNVSTMASFVAAAAGAVVCKHGNVKASSTSGSFDFLAQLGIKIDITPAQLEACVAETGLGFAFAKAYHPAMRFAGPVRADLGIPTVFNLLGPLAHPGRVQRQVIGTATEEIARQMADVLVELGSEKAWVVTGQGGLDEIATSGPSIIFEVDGATIVRREIDLSFLGISATDSMDAIAGGDAARNVEIFHAILDGSEVGARRDIVALNAAAALVVAGKVTSLRRGLQAAEEAIADGRAAAKLDEVTTFTNRDFSIDAAS